jgi:hypothetical protein
VEHSELILHCYRRLLEQFEGLPTMAGDHNSHLQQRKDDENDG